MSNLPTPPALEHPRWCKRDDTCPDGVHRGRAFTATTSGSVHDMRVWLEQIYWPAVGAPMVVLEITEQGDPRYYTLPVEQCRVLRFQLTQLLAAASGGRR